MILSLAACNTLQPQGLSLNDQAFSQAVSPHADAIAPSHINEGSPSLLHHTQDKKAENLFPKKISATGKRTFIFDPKLKAWSAYDENGNLVKTGRASGGRGYCPDIHRSCRTPQGKFAVYEKKGEECVSTKFPVGEGGAPMPNCMFFHGGYAIHGSYAVPDYNASHGCIRVLPSAAEWLNQEFIRVGTAVIVRPYGG